MNQDMNLTPKTSSPERIHVGDRIKKLLGQKGMSQTDLAKKLNLTPQSISNTIKNASMNTDTLQDMLAAIGVSFIEFVEAEEISSGVQAQLDEINRRLDRLEGKGEV